MRRKEREITDPKLLEEILKGANICRLAISNHPYPYIVALNYGYADNSLFIHCAKEGKKIDLLRKNNKVGFQIERGSEIIPHEESCQWTTKYRSIIGTGEVEMIDDFDEKCKGLDVIMNHSGKADNSYHPKAVDKVLILKVKINEFSGKQAGDW
ncbi:pyridoxamine 5'-phosphate oxidase family protein [Marinifilum caeruleilacunae]|uniref:Pyridoxamine 5'-phosphate oxidase family protein n=1 Tax=Marinifilum caeruleilacunae TaxID=2499076 RepID=A0ABX1WUM6_9BACT|nr:pyridoxamine 5'-phosphate oxidase family protein [Marinifilum caeruleilacunae]NOU59790.1 pyridoxamine 5'-phosphate oxidase family protein [Marinifilum caeruleilacunae]